MVYNLILNTSFMLDILLVLPVIASAGFRPGEVNIGETCGGDGHHYSRLCSRYASVSDVSKCWLE